MTAETAVDVGGRVVQVSSLDRVLWPGAGVTKGELIGYYVAVADVLLPHLRGRPCALHRFPEGLAGPHFYQIRAPSAPDWVRTVRMTPPESGKVFDMVVVDDLPTLVWAANLSAIELHPYLHAAGDPDRATAVVVDLDPYPPAGLREAAEVALHVRDLLTGNGLAAWAKASGGRGLHVHADLREPMPFETTKTFAHRLAGELTQLLPDVVTLRRPKDRRAGRVYVDWAQNDTWKSTIAPYSLRGVDPPRVAAPVTWDAVAAAAGGDVTAVLAHPSDVVAGLPAPAGSGRF